MKVNLILQARMNSARLPGKVLKDINGVSVLETIFKRLSNCKMLDNIIVATTTNNSDDIIADVCSKNNINYYRGSENNVLDRFYQAAKISETDIVVMCTADCPLIDFKIVDDMIDKFIINSYIHYCHEYYGGNMGFPDGFDVNIVLFKFLEKEWQKQREEKNIIEHACGHMLNVYGNGTYKIPILENNKIELKNLHLSLDTENDYELICNIFNNLEEGFGVHDVLRFLNDNINLLNNNSNSVKRKGPELYNNAKKIIPGGTQLLSKRPEMFLPNNWPAYYQYNSGIEITTLDGVKMKDFSIMGIGACILGYCDPDVNKAVKISIDRGNMSTLNSPNEVELTKLLLELHPWADMVRYCRGGGEADSIAVRIARAASKKDKIAFCGYHGWHDWYLSANWNSRDALGEHLLGGLSPEGVPKNLKDTAFPFKYNDYQGLLNIISCHDIGTIIMEPIRSEQPKNDFLYKIRKLCNEKNIILIFDEVSSGFRLNTGGIHLLYDIQPDIAIFAKAMGNGYPIGAIVGIKEIMSYAENTFISSTYWTEDIGFSAAIATIKKHKECDVGNHISELGMYFQREIKKIAKNSNIDISISGLPCFSAFTFNYVNSMAIKTLYIQEMLSRNILAKNALYLSYAHKKSDIDYYLKHINEVFVILNDKITNEKVEESLLGPIAHNGFKRLA